MSRFDSDLDYYEWLNGPDPTECPWFICTDCNRELRKEDDDQTCCDTCLQRRSEFDVSAADARRI